MRYEFVAIPDADVPPAADPAYRHLPDTYASETNKTASVWRANPDDRLVDYLLATHGLIAKLIGASYPAAG